MNDAGVFSNTVDRIGIITLSRPPHNFFDEPMISHIADLIDAFDNNPAIRVCLLISNQKNFCAGANFSGGNRPDPKPIYDAATRLAAHRKPLIAAIRGAAVGGGLGLALAADFRIGADNCWFQANFVKIGLSPGFGITYTLPRIVGEQLAKDLLLTGRRIEATEAQSIRLIDRLVPTEELDEAAMALAREMTQSSPAAMYATQQLLSPNAVGGYVAAVCKELAVQRPLFISQDFDEGVAAAREKRAPKFADFPVISA